MPTKNKIVDRSSFIKQVNDWNVNGYKVVFTNGCFDIIHLGHVDYLEKASEMGDKLVIGLNSDKSVLELKGLGRPVNDFESRSRILAALSFVDLITEFDEPTPLSLIAESKPGVLIKGSDYDLSKIVGANVVLQSGGEVKTIELTDGHSSSKIIERIKELKE